MCGAPNARAGMLGVFAPPGAVIPRTGMVLKASAIRGVASNGMLCSGYELGLGEDHEGIIELPAGRAGRRPLRRRDGARRSGARHQGDANRADCLGVRGIARDLAAAGLGPAEAARRRSTPVPGTFPLARSPCISPDPTTRPVRCSSAASSAACSNGPSPRWLQPTGSRRSGCGRSRRWSTSPISSPSISTGRCTSSTPARSRAISRARGARPGEKLAALNGQDYALDAEMTVIADDDGVSSLGGVIGGESTGCTEATTDVFIEAALFDPCAPPRPAASSTSAERRALSLRARPRSRIRAARPRDRDAADPRNSAAASRARSSQSGAVPDWRRQYRASGPARTCEPRRPRGRAGGAAPHPRSARLRASRRRPARWRSSRRPGAATSRARPISSRKCCASTATTTFRPCRCRARRRCRKPGARSGAAPRRLRAPQRSPRAASIEAVTFSFLPAAQARALRRRAAPQLRLANPISADLDAMRPSILPNLLDAARRNADRGFPDGALFEIGPQYRDDTPEGQVAMAAGLRAGRTGAKRWDDPGRPVDAFLAKADALAALAAAGVAADTSRSAPIRRPGITPAAPARCGSGRSCSAFGETPSGACWPRSTSRAGGRVRDLPRRRAAAARPRPRPAAAAAVAVPAGRARLRLRRRRRPAGRDAAARRARRRQEAHRRGAALRRLSRRRPARGKKSLAITVVLQPREATLTDAQIDGFSKRLVAAVEKATGGTLRG